MMYVGYFQGHHHFEDVVDRRRLSDTLGDRCRKGPHGRRSTWIRAIETVSSCT